MKILYISTESVPGSVGGSVRTFELAKALKRLGHKITIFTDRRNGQKREEIIDGVEIIRSKIKFGKTAPILGTKRLDMFRKDFDVVIERYSILGGVGTIYSKVNGVPLVIEVNAPQLEEAIATKAIDGDLMKIFATKMKDIQFRSADKIITTRKSLVKGYEEKTIEMTLGGVNQRVFRPNLRRSKKSQSIRRMYGMESDFVLVFHGAFTRWHGITDLMKAARIIEKRDPKIKFLLIGNGPLEKKAKSMARKNCIFTGEINYNEIPFYLSASDVGVAPYGILAPHLKNIGFYWSPMKIFEYMSLGLPVITSDFKELQNIVKKNGMFYPPGNANALAKTILKMRKSKIRVRQSNEYSWDTQARQLNKILKNLVSREKP